MRVFQFLKSEKKILPVPKPKESHKALIYNEEAKRIAKLTLQYPSIETGGSLFGYWTHSKSPIVSLASGPGRGSRHNHTSFYQNETYLHDMGTELYDQHGMQHIGEWHSHHRLGLNQPSEGDVNTIRLGMRQKGWSHFLLLITTIKNPKEGLVLENFFLFSEPEVVPEPLRIVLLAGSSPFRIPEYDKREEPCKMLPKLAWQLGPFTPGTRRSAREVFPDAWFTSASGRSRLVKIASDFSERGINCRMIPQKSGLELKLLLGEDELLLDSGFPQKAPQWFGSKPATNLEPWLESTNLVEWYLANKKQNVEPSTPVEKGGNKDAI